MLLPTFPSLDRSIMAKSTNYLASPIERQRQFKIPAQNKINELIELTNKLKQAWKPLLPDEILDTLMVIHYDSEQLVITTNNHTIANHLNYTYQMLLELLHNEYSYLQSLSHIKFKVINTPKAHTAERNLEDTLIPSHLKNNLKNGSKVASVTSRKLSPTTRQNITQLVQNVTLDNRLKAVLLRLANGE